MPSVITLPNTISNGDVSDAPKVNGNINAIVNRYNTDVGAHSGDLVSTGELNTDATLADDSDEIVSSQKAIKAYADTKMPITSALPISSWILISAILTYSSTDGHIFVCTTSVDLTSVIGVGMRLKLTHGGAVKYFIVQAIDASTITLYGGTDYSITGTAITLVSYSSAKAPIGFPMSPAKWSEVATNTSNSRQASPTPGTWYNVGTFKIDAPIGVWNAGYQAGAFVQNTSAATDLGLYVTLSTANNSESDASWTCIRDGRVGSAAQFHNTNLSKSGLLTCAVKTTYYLNFNAIDASTSIGLSGTCEIKLVNSYL